MWFESKVKLISSRVSCSYCNMAKKKKGYEFWSDVLMGAKYVVAPMVDQSELAWRMLSRKYGAELCYTPMLHASVFRRDANYRRENLVTCSEDRPLIVQFCANDPQTLLEAARYAEPHCDAIDLNLGCPQSIARKGHYGAFLQDEWDLLSRMVSLLHWELSVPVTCKIRVFEDVEKTVQYARMLEAAGCQLLTVHGRTREQKGPNTELASWEHIQAVRRSVCIPVFANGNIQFLRDVERCLEETGVDGVMSAEGSLFNPALFTGEQPPCWRVVGEYLDLVRRYPCPISFIRGHLFKLWLHVLKQPEYQHYRVKIGTARSLEAMESISRELKALLQARVPSDELDADFSLDSIPFWRCQPYVRPSPVEQLLKRSRSISEGSDGGEVACVVKRKKERRKEVVITPKPSKWIMCLVCKGNPKGQRCVYDLCKTCCKAKCWTEKLDCAGHKFFVRTKLEMKQNCLEMNSHSTPHLPPDSPIAEHSSAAVDPPG